MDTWRRLTAEELAREEMFRERFVWCVVCHALMIHAMLGFYYCPYQRIGHHEHAVRALKASHAESQVCHDALKLHP